MVAPVTVRVPVSVIFPVVAVAVKSPPIVVGDTVVTPESISSYNINKEQVPGWTRGWDARTGERKWTFRTVPQGDDFGNDTWEGDSWRYSGKVSGWSIYSADEELGYLYVPLNTVAPDYWDNVSVTTCSQKRCFV